MSKSLCKHSPNQFIKLQLLAQAIKKWMIHTKVTPYGE